MTRPDCIPSLTYKVTTECGAFYLIMALYKDELYEVRMELGKTGHCHRGFLHLLSVLLSDKIQNVSDKKELKRFIEKHLSKFSCGCPFIWRGENYKSCIDYAGTKLLEKIKIDPGTEQEQKQDSKQESKQDNRSALPLDRTSAKSPTAPLSNNTE